MNKLINMKWSLWVWFRSCSSSRIFLFLVGRLRRSRCGSDLILRNFLFILNIIYWLIDDSIPVVFPFGFVFYIRINLMENSGSKQEFWAKQVFFFFSILKKVTYHFGAKKFDFLVVWSKFWNLWLEMRCGFG